MCITWIASEVGKDIKEEQNEQKLVFRYAKESLPTAKGVEK